MTEQNAMPQTGSTVKGYRTLTADEIEMMNQLKRTSALFLEQLAIVRQHVQTQYKMAHAAPAGDEQNRLDDAEPMRWLAMAKTEMQHACMFGCRAIAQPSGNS